MKCTSQKVTHDHLFYIKIRTYDLKKKRNSHSGIEKECKCHVFNVLDHDNRTLIEFPTNLQYQKLDIMNSYDPYKS